MVRNALELVSVDRPDKVLEVNAIISRHVREVLISDYVAGELGIVAHDFRRGSGGSRTRMWSGGASST